MAEKGRGRKLDLDGVDVRVGCVLRKMGVETVGQLLELKEYDFIVLQNCGVRTAEKILRLQGEYGKDIGAAKKGLSQAGECVSSLRELHKLQGALLKELAETMIND